MTEGTIRRLSDMTLREVLALPLVKKITAQDIRAEIFEDWARIAPTDGTIQSRHWLSTAKVCRLPASEVRTALELFASNIETAVAQVDGRLPVGFPDAVARPIFEGLRAARRGVVGRFAS